MSMMVSEMPPIMHHEVWSIEVIDIVLETHFLHNFELAPFTFSQYHYCSFTMEVLFLVISLC